MTLYRQLLIFTLLLFLVLFIGVWIEKLQSTRSFLVDQLASHAQDTATSLGLSLSPVIAENDFSTAETMMNAVFDRGYYRVIRFTDIHGEVISERSQKVVYAGVPTVFIKLVPLVAPSATSHVMGGWNQVGTLYVESHPGYAYRTLWETVVGVSVYFLLMGGLVLLFGGLGLRMLLRPLQRLELQAEAISRREYTIQEDLPRTRELRRVVESMNKLASRVRDMFEEQAQVAERLRTKAYSDQLTGLGNRRYLNGQMAAGLDAGLGTTKGGLLLVQIQDLQRINEKKGLSAGDDILIRTAAILQQGASRLNNAALARLTGGDFALFLPEASPDDVSRLAENLSAQLALLAIEDIGISKNIAQIGAVTYDQAPTMQKLLAAADIALREASNQAQNTWKVMVLTPDESMSVKGKYWWRDKLDQVLHDGDILTYAQSVVDCWTRQTLLHKELLSRISLAPGEIVSAGVFVPLAEHMQMVSRLDRVMMEQAFLLNSEMIGGETVAVNLSPSSLNDVEFKKWLLDRLKNLPGDSLRYIFEFAEFGAIRSMERLKDFSSEVQQLGHGVGLDHFGQSLNNFGYLQTLRPAYVKIDRGFVRELEQQGSDIHFFIGALCGVAHSLDIQVIAEGVEREEQVPLLLDLNIDAMQGYLIDQPKEIKKS